jgi:hypothetical protein
MIKGKQNPERKDLVLLGIRNGEGRYCPAGRPEVEYPWKLGAG